MKQLDIEEVQLIWEEVHTLSPEELDTKYMQLEKDQPEIMQFIGEELEGIDHVYLESSNLWLLFCCRVVQTAYKKKGKLPKIKLNILHEIIDKAQDEIGPKEVDEYCETSGNILLTHIMDLVAHIDTKKPEEEEGEEATGTEEELTDIEESYESGEYGDYEMEEKEGDEDYMIFKEMYDEHDEGTFEEEELSEQEYARYIILLMFKSIIDGITQKLKDSKKS
jgi:hypothetical protein